MASKRARHSSRNAAKQRRRQTGMGFEETGFALLAQEAPEQPEPAGPLPVDPRQTIMEGATMPEHQRVIGGASRGGVVAERRELRRQAKERRAVVLPRLRAAVRDAKRARVARLRACKSEMLKRRRRVKRAADQAARELERRIEKARKQASAAAAACKTRAAKQGTAEIERALGELGTEREAIAALGRKARGLRSEHGAKGGRRAAELRAESDDAVRHELGDDRALLALWERLRGKIKGTRRTSRAEVFFDYLHNHPELVDEERARQEQRYEREAAELLSKAAAPLPTDSDELRDCLAMLGECERHCARAPAAPPF